MDLPAIELHSIRKTCFTRARPALRPRCPGLSSQVSCKNLVEPGELREKSAEAGLLRNMAKRILSEQHWSVLAAEARYSATELARLRNISVRQLHRHILRAFDLPLQKWLNRERLKASRQLLLSGQPVKRVCFELGFKQPSHFCRRFKCMYNMTPGEFAATLVSHNDCARNDPSSEIPSNGADLVFKT